MDSSASPSQMPALKAPPGGWSAAAHSADSDGELDSDASDLAGQDTVDVAHCEPADVTRDGLQSLGFQLPPLNTQLQPEFVEAGRQEPLLLPSFLSKSEILQVLGVADSMSEVEFCSVGRSVVGHDVAYSESHVALNLHRDGAFVTALPALMSKIVEGMRSQPDHWCDPAMALNVRCVEYHTYHAGDGLMTDGHKDYGSVLSMSILLSQPNADGGGQLMTWKDGAQVAHAMGRGDALLFPSLKTHNVSPIAHGERRSLVIELWAGETNRNNRYT